MDSNQPRLHYNLGVVYERIGRLPEAREEYEAASKARPNWAEALGNLGIVQHRLGDNRTAEKTLREVLRADPNDARALNNLGVVLAALGQRDEAVQAYRSSLKVNPRYAQAIGNLAALLEQEGKLTEAMEELKRLLSLEPGDVESHLRLASILRRMENFPEAIENDLAVLAAQPGNGEALRGLAWEYGKMGRADKALEYYTQLERNAPEDQSFRLDRALLLSDTGKPDLARQEVLRYLESFPEDQKARVLLSDIYAAQGQKKQAAQTLREVLAADPQQKNASYRLAKLYRQLGESQKAVETMEGLINTLELSAEPEDMDALSEAMEEYEQTIAEHEKDFRDDREKTIRKLRELSVDSVKSEKAPVEEDSLMIEDLEPLGEDAVPIISVGGMEPVFAVREEDEELKLEEVDESVQDETVSIEDERPPNLVNLLKDQELYEENPALETFQPSAPFPQQPRGSGQATPPQAPSLPSPQPAASQPALSAQGENVLAKSLKESVETQQRMVDKLFGEISDLSRKIEEQKRPPQIVPIMMNPPPQRQARVPQQPIMMDYPPSSQATPDYPRSLPPEDPGKPPSSSGLPRFDDAEADQDAAPPQAAAAARPDEEEAVLEEVPEEIAADVAEEIPLLEPADEAGTPGSEAANGPGRASAPEQPAQGSETSAGEPAPESRTSDDVRNELREYLNGVKNRLDGPADLLDYLGKLSDYLPEREKQGFLGSTEHLAMESLKSQLAGNRGLRQKIAERFRPAAPQQERAADPASGCRHVLLSQGPLRVAPGQGCRQSDEGANRVPHGPDEESRIEHEG